jgi:hypothetical protein
MAHCLQERIPAISPNLGIRGDPAVMASVLLFSVFAFRETEIIAKIGIYKAVTSGFPFLYR